jgi:hypothetical protein
MTKRSFLILGIGLLAPLFVGFSFHCDLVGWWRGEAKYKGRFTNSWRIELRQYDQRLAMVSLGIVSWEYRRKPTQWERLLAKVLPSKQVAILHLDPPLQEGDIQAIPVLLELLCAPEPNVRALAVRGLGEVGPAARTAVPSLQSALNDESDEVAHEAASALHSIDKSSLDALGLGDGKWLTYRSLSFLHELLDIAIPKAGE